MELFYEVVVNDDFFAVVSLGNDNYNDDHKGIQQKLKRKKQPTTKQEQ